MKHLFSNHNYLRLLIGYSLSIFVDSVVFMIAIKQIEIMNNSTTSYTALYWFHYLPSILFSLWIGAWIGFKKIEMIMRNTIFLRIIVLVVFIAVSGIDNLTYIYLYIFLESLFAIFILPSTDTLVTRIVHKENRTEANAMVKLGFVLMQILGYGVTTVLIKVDISLSMVLIACVILLLIGLVSFAQIDVVYSNPLEKTKSNVSREIKELLDYLLKNKLTLNIFILFAIAWLVASSIDIIVLSYLTQHASVSSENFGIVAIFVFIGMIIGSLLASYIYGRLPLKYVFSLPLIVYTFTVMSMYIFENWIFTLPFFLLGGISLGIFEVSFTTYLQDYNEPKFYTRIFSIQSMILSVMPLPGLLFLGTFIEFLGVGNTIIAVSILLGGLSIFASSILKQSSQQSWT